MRAPSPLALCWTARARSITIAAAAYTLIPQAYSTGLQPVAASLGCTLPQLGIAWCLKNPNVSTVILGASKAAQVTENLAALALLPKLTSEKLAEIDEVLGNVPKANKEWGGRGPGRNAP